MNRPGSIALTVGAAASSAIILIAFFKAPLLPVAAGAIIAVIWLLRRRPAV